MRVRTVTMAALAAVGLAGCGTPSLQLPPPRTLVIQSGARLSPEEDRLKTVYEWVDAEIRNIEEDPSFLIAVESTTTDVYPWETLLIEGDTARVRVRRTNPDLGSVYQIYAHLHLMRAMGREEEWIPEAAGMQGWEFERRAVQRVADAWLLGRASFGFAPYRLMDELAYAREGGQLDALLLTLRSHEFPEEQEAWLATDPDGEETFRAWYRETFGRDFDPGF
ncbi:MAG: hypothetical protein RQ751_10495 [Longimicrobiales bacterium]|nr:hypothetical protein [Longimicrobiales bacterium]